MGSISKSIISVLDRNGKTQQDVQYVIYALGKSLSTRSLYCCNFQNFSSATANATSGFDLNWPFEIKIVGIDFWISFDYRND